MSESRNLPPIRLACEKDASSMLEIYAPLVLDSIISFEFEPPSVDVFADRVGKTLRQYPWLICAPNQQALGYAYATRHRERPAYQWDVEVSVYVHHDSRRRGIARRLYAALFELLSLQGYYNAFAGIALPNPPSVALHEALGFDRIGVYERTGFKQGAWHDVGWWQFSLPQPAGTPALPKSIQEVIRLPQARRIVQN